MSDWPAVTEPGTVPVDKLPGHAEEGWPVGTTSEREKSKPAAPAPPKRRTFWSATDLMAHSFPAPRWAVPGVVAEGVTLFAGAPKVGKSWLALGLAAAVAAGGVALGDIAVEEGEVLYLALEDTPRRLKDRLTKVLKGSDPPRRLSIAVEFNGDEIRDWLARKDKRLLIVDVLARVRPAVPPGTQAYDADYRSITRIKSIADDHGIAALCVHHTRKMAASDFLEEVSGTNGLAGAADSILVLKRSRGKADGELHITGRDVDEAEHALTFDPDLGLWSRLPGDPQKYKLGDTRADILSHLEKYGSVTPKQAAETLGIEPAAARQALSRMARDGQIDTDGKGTYMPVTPVTPVTDRGLLL